MASSTILHTVVFAVGAAVGAGLTVSLSSQKRRPEPSMQADKNGALSILQKGVVPGDIFKYGNPGRFVEAFGATNDVSNFHSGPISDLLLRKVYAVGYDRRLRHPSWVCIRLA
jgi:endonuclease G